MCDIILLLPTYIISYYDEMGGNMRLEMCAYRANAYYTVDSRSFKPSIIFETFGSSNSIVVARSF